MSQPLVLAIEPDLRQAAIVKRIVREKALADVIVVDSRDAAIEAVRTCMPDVLLLSALLSPRDEDELIAHLRTLDNAAHLQTHTIPQLASTLDAGEERSSRGLLSAFRRKKGAAPVAGCDPDLFAEEIRSYLAQAASKKREPQSAPFVPPVSRREQSAPDAVEASAHHESEEASTPGSSWASPFEWKPASSSAKRSPRSREDAPAQSPGPAPAPEPEPMIAAPAAAEPIVEAPSVIKPVEEPMVAAPEQPVAPQPVVEPLVAASRIVEPPVVEPPVVERPVLESVLVADAVVIQPPPGSLVSERVGKLVDPPAKKARTETARPKPVADRPAKLTRAQLQDLIRKQAASDRLGHDGLGPLTRWARSDAPSAAKNASVTSDDVHSLISELAVPIAVASVTYPTGVRLRRVRVPLSSDHDAVQASA